MHWRGIREKSERLEAGTAVAVAASEPRATAELESAAVAAPPRGAFAAASGPVATPARRAGDTTPEKSPAGGARREPKEEITIVYQQKSGVPPVCSVCAASESVPWRTREDKKPICNKCSLRVRPGKRTPPRVLNARRVFRH